MMLQRMQCFDGSADLRRIDHMRTFPPWLCVGVAAIALVMVFVVHVTYCLAATTDAESVRRYVGATYAELRREVTKLPAAQHAVNEVAAKVKHECLNSLTSAPRGTAREAFAQESAGAAFAAVMVPFARDVRKHARAVLRLPWQRQSTLMHLVHQETRDELAEVSLIEPHLCNDVRAWAHGGYVQLPITTVRFDRDFATLLHASQPAARIRHLISHYEDAYDVRLMRQITQLELQIGATVLRAWELGTADIQRTLGLWTLAE